MIIKISDCVTVASVWLLAHSAFAVAVSVDPDCVGMGAVSWSERKLTNETSRLTLKATSEEGFAFANWSVAETDVVAWSEDLRYPGSLVMTVKSNAEITATFIACADDRLAFDISDLFPEELACGEDFAEVLSVDSQTFPTVTFRNLPHGLTFDNRTLTVFGKPDVPGLYRIEAKAVNESGFAFLSTCTVRISNVEDARVSGVDTVIAVDEYFYSEIGNGDASDIFTFAEIPLSVSLFGSVPGLVWSNGWSVIYGTPTEVGEYTLKVKASFPTGRDETATMTLSVVGGNADEYGLDLEVLECLLVGDTFDDICVIGVDTSDFAIRSVSGLPTGLSAKRKCENGTWRWLVSGMVRTPGFFTVTVLVDDLRSDVIRTVKVVRTISVADVPEVYLSVSSEDLSRGSVSGGGAISPFEDVTLVAVPKNGFVFSGWFDGYGDRLDLEDGVDYRAEKIKLSAGTDFSFLAPVAHFAAAADDVAPDLSELEEVELSFAPGDSFEVEFSVDSLSLPTLTFNGLPKGMSCAANGTGGFTLVYDPSSAVAASGRYSVTVTAVNSSGRKSSATFRVTVEPRSDVRISVYDDYGEFAPGEEVDPIDLSDAVDFDRGETLSVSGLPKGLAYNAKANEKKGIEAHTITGTPTVPGDYTLTFSAKVVSGETTNRSGKVSYRYETVKASAFMTILPYPELEIDVYEDAAEAGCKVTGAGNYKAGTKVSLKATAAKGWVFAGWEGLDELDGLAALNPKISYVTGEDDVWAQACFVPVSEDGLTVYVPEPTESGYAAEWALKEPLVDDEAALIANLIETVSWPTVRVDGLPSGVKFTAATLLLSGAPTKSGVYHVTVTAKSAGGYSFVRVLDIAVLNGDGSLPTEKPLANDAEIDFSPLKSLMTGVHCQTGAVVLTIGPKPASGSPVKKVSISGLPAGVKASTALADDGASVEVTGTPSKPGRFVVSVSVTYADGKTLKSQAAIVVEDGGSAYLFVTSSDPDAGTVTGEGVYASGSTVKLVAKAKSKHVFAGWEAPDEVGESEFFEPLRELDGIDPRTASVSFPFRPLVFAAGCELKGVFVASADDYASEIDIESDVWKIDPAESSSFAFAVDSQSVPKVTVSGLPKGVTVDAVRGSMTYAPNASTAPGIYAATVSAKNVTQKQASTRSFEVRVANRVSEVIGGLDPDMDAYPVSVGVTLDPTLIAPAVDEGWTLSAKGLPSGLSFKNGAVTGVPSKAGDYTVTFTATSGSGKNKQTETATVTLRVSALPSTLGGTFTGVLETEAGETAGTVEITAASSGKVSVSAKIPSKNYAFTAKSWDAFTNGIASVGMENRDGSHLNLNIMSEDDWTTWQASGVLTAGEDRLFVTAQRNPYGTKDGVTEAREVAKSMAGSSTLDGWKITVTAKGTVSFAGKYDGKSLSGSTVLQISEEKFFARHVKFLDKKSLITLVFNLDENGHVEEWTAERR